MEKATYFGDLERVKTLVEQEATCTPKAVTNAAYNGHLEVLEWLKEHYGHLPTTSEAFDKSASFDRLESLEWLRVHTDARPTPEAFSFCYGKNGLRILEWMAEHYPEVGYTDEAIQQAGVRHRHETLTWLLTHRELFLTQQLREALEVLDAGPAEAPAESLVAVAKRLTATPHDRETIRRTLEYHRDYLYSEALLTTCECMLSDVHRYKNPDIKTVSRTMDLLVGELNSILTRLPTDEFLDQYPNVRGRIEEVRRTVETMRFKFAVVELTEVLTQLSTRQATMVKEGTVRRLNRYWPSASEQLTGQLDQLASLFRARTTVVREVVDAIKVSLTTLELTEVLTRLRDQEAQVHEQIQSCLDRAGAELAHLDGAQVRE